MTLAEKTADHIVASSEVAVTRYDRDVRSEANASGLAIVETRLEEAFSGDLEGIGHATHLRLERVDGSGMLLCYERIEGVLNGRRGSFLLEASGEMSSDRYVHGRWEIIPASGTDDLKDIRGYAAFMAKQDPSSPSGWKASTNLTYWFDAPVSPEQ
jgi:Protein of unknown function (DUF3224)